MAEHWAAIEQALELARYDEDGRPILGVKTSEGVIVCDWVEDFIGRIPALEAAVGEAKRYEGILLAGMRGASDNAAQLAEELGEAKRRESELERKAGIWRAGMRGTSDNAAGLAAERDAAEVRVAELERALSEEFFRQLPDLDYETEDGWAWRAHPWFVLLGLTDEECFRALGVRGAAGE